jgi:hypothetical protein
MTRYFQLNTHLALPQDLISMPPGKPGDVVELDTERCKLFGRFLRLRELAGDLVELEAPPETTPAAAIAPPPTPSAPPAPNPLAAPAAPPPPTAPKE